MILIQFERRDLILEYFTGSAQRRPIVVDGICIGIFGIAADNTLLYELHIFPALHNLHRDFSPGQNIIFPLSEHFFVGQSNKEAEKGWGGT